MLDGGSGGFSPLLRRGNRDGMAWDETGLLERVVAGCVGEMSSGGLA